GDGEFANVVQHGGRTNGIQLSVVHAEVLGNLDRIDLDATQMIVGGVIFRFDSQRKRLDGAQVQRSDFLGVVFLRLEAAQVGLIGPVDPINDGESQKAELPADQPVDGAHSTSDQRTEQVIREGPQIAFLPNVDGIAPLSHGDNSGNGDRVEGKVSRRRCGHQHGPSKPDASSDFAMKNQFCSANGEGQICQVKQPLDRAVTL